MLWQKDVTVADWVTRFTVGDDYRWDTILLPYDIAGTRVQAWSLARIGVLTEDDLARTEEALDALARRYAEGGVQVRPEDEDCHTVVERYLTEQLGDLGKKIHTGRSRNDQVLVALRLFLVDGLRRLGARTTHIAETLCDFGERYDRLVMPGYTHLQRAMPTTAGLWAMGYAELFADDLDGLVEAAGHVNVSPLGSAAGYGVPYLPLPREEAAQRLGFDRPQLHVTAVQLSRGKLELTAAHAVLQLAATVNRMASDLVLFNTSEFGFVELPAEYCTGSSIMPQKQNPDVLELARASYHRIAAELQLLITLPANLPSGYHRDLQLTKEAVMRTVLLGDDLLTAIQHLLPGVRFRPDKLEAATTPELYATAFALEQVREGVPFRDAYRDAARRVTDLQAPDADATLGTYAVAGYPGQCRPEAIRRRLARHTAWVEKA